MKLRVLILGATCLIGLSLGPGGPAIAGRSQPTANRKQLAQAERLLVQGQVQEASELLGQLARAFGSEPRWQRLQAEALFQLGDYQQALRVARDAARSNRTGQRVKGLRNLIAATLEAVKGFVSHRSPGGHFAISMPAGKDEILAPFAGQTLEAMRKQLQQQLGYAPPDVVRVEVYPNPEALAEVSPLTIEEITRSGTIALSKYNRLMIVTPRALPRGYPWLDTLAHEYIHLVVTRLTLNQSPVWIQEGLAKFFEAAWRHPSATSLPLAPVQEHLLAEALRAKRLIRWEQMHPSMAKLPDQRAVALAFAQVQTAIDFVARSAGVTALRRLTDELRAGKADWVALRTATGLGRAEFDTSWRKHLRSLGLRRLTGLVPPELTFGKAQTAEQRIAAVKEGRARKLLRLAEMLRQRRLTRAAIVEYQKARGLLGQRDELTAIHLARAYLEISSPAQALSALLPVLEYYPELPGAQTTMGVAHLRNNDPESAQRHFLTALRINPFDPEIHCGLAKALRSKSPREAELHRGFCAKLEH